METRWRIVSIYRWLNVRSGDQKEKLESAERHRSEKKKKKKKRQGDAEEQKRKAKFVIDLMKNWEQAERLRTFVKHWKRVPHSWTFRRRAA